MNVNNIMTLVSGFQEKTIPDIRVVFAVGEKDFLKSRVLLEGDFFFMTDGQTYMPAYAEDVTWAWFEDSTLFLDWTYIMLIDQDGRVSKIVVSSVDGDWENLTAAFKLLDPTKEVALWEAKSYKLAYPVTKGSLDRYK